ncbi:MAG: Maf family nucleotide pyrophosphatase [Bacteroidota bacterium]
MGWEKIYNDVNNTVGSCFVLNFISHLSLTNSFIKLDILKQKIILASQSPRRKQLMREAGFLNFTTRSTDVEENYPSDLPVQEIAPFLARKKAMKAKPWIEKDEIVLTADSVVLLGNKVYEKPKDYEDAVRILKELSGQMHQVITGVCLCSKEKERVFSGTTDVYFDDLANDEINYYIHTFKPYDKAGSYGVQEWLGHCKVRKLEGSFTNVMGLPMHLVYKELSAFLKES